jgi:hypothetical protein
MFFLVAKDKLVNVRLTPEKHAEFKVACELRGASMSSLLHQFIVRTIREEKELSPQAFQRELSVNGNLRPAPEPIPLTEGGELRDVDKTSRANRPKRNSRRPE